MKYDLARMAARAGSRRKFITLCPIVTTRAQAGDLARVMHRVLAPWYEAPPRIAQAYERELQRMLQQDSIDDLAALFSEIADAVEGLLLELTPAMREWAFSLERWHRGKWGRTVLAGANVDVSYLIGPADAQEPISASLARNAALVKDISRQAEARISDAVYRGLQARTPAREVGKQIAEATGMARTRANRVAADQTVKLSSALDAQRQREAGLDVWRWRHSAKLHPRKIHLERDGNLYADDAASRGQLPNGDTVAEPPKEKPGELPFCGCVRQAVLLIGGMVL